MPFIKVPDDDGEQWFNSNHIISFWHNDVLGKGTIVMTSDGDTYRLSCSPADFMRLINEAQRPPRRRTSKFLKEMGY